MRLARVSKAGRTGIACALGDEVRVRFDPLDSRDPSSMDLDSAFQAGPAAVAALHRQCALAPVEVEDDLEFLPPLRRSPKIICVGLNYIDHAVEVAFAVPTFPTLFARFATSLIGHGTAITKPGYTEQFDFEGELVAVVGRTGRHITSADALDHIAAYSIFNDVTARDYQLRSTQWTAGKNFDGTGAFGPWLVTADELPPGAAGLGLTTRLNGDVVQKASTSDMIFTVADLVVTLSQFMTLEAGDVLVTGTPAGVGMGRTPPLYMTGGDVCEVEIEGIGLLHNSIVDAR